MWMCSPVLNDAVLCPNSDGRFVIYMMSFMSSGQWCHCSSAWSDPMSYTLAFHLRYPRYPGHGVVVDPDSIPGILSWRWEYTKGQFRVVLVVFLESWRKPTCYTDGYCGSGWSWGRAPVSETPQCASVTIKKSNTEVSSGATEKHSVYRQSERY